MTPLVDFQIRELCASYGMIEPFNPFNIQPASIDVTLGEDFLVAANYAVEIIDLHKPDSYANMMKEVKTYGQRFVLHPGEFALGHTAEVVHIPDNVVSRLEGKSSLGRFGLQIHSTAGFIDPGFHGAVTLEMKNVSMFALVLYPGDLIAQLSFDQASDPCEKPYAGRYQGDKGVAPSRYTYENRNRQPEHESLEIAPESSPAPQLLTGQVAVNPSDNVAYVVKEYDRDNKIFTVTDQLGGHEQRVQKNRWESWPLIAWESPTGQHEFSAASLGGSHRCNWCGVFQGGVEYDAMASVLGVDVCPGYGAESGRMRHMLLSNGMPQEKVIRARRSYGMHEQSEVN